MRLMIYQRQDQSAFPATCRNRPHSIIEGLSMQRQKIGDRKSKPTLPLARSVNRFLRLPATEIFIAITVLVGCFVLAEQTVSLDFQSRIRLNQFLRVGSTVWTTLFIATGMFYSVEVTSPHNH
eukprot:760036-Hanusia_phi.AAC.2